MQRRPYGFTLIELMFAVTIAGILAAVALPAYNDYMIRSRVLEGVLAAGQCRTAVSEGYQVRGMNSAGFQPDGWGCNEGVLMPTTYVEVVHTDDTGVIYVTMNPNDARLGGARGQDIILEPIVSGGNFNPNSPQGLSGDIRGWRCRPGPTMPPVYLPSTCR